jgi:hypothetical protein
MLQNRGCGENQCIEYLVACVRGVVLMSSHRNGLSTSPIIASETFGIVIHAGAGSRTWSTCPHSVRTCSLAHATAKLARHGSHDRAVFFGVNMRPYFAGRKSLV